MPFFLEYPPPKGFHSWNIIARILFSIHSRSLLSRRNLLYKKSIRRRQSNSQRNSRDLSYLFLLNVPNIRKKKKRKEKTRLASKLRYRINFLPIFRLSFQFFTRGLALQLIIRYCREKICS